MPTLVLYREDEFFGAATRFMGERIPGAKNGVSSSIGSALGEQGVDWTNDIRPAIGPELVVVATANREPVVLVQPSDEAKLDALLANIEASKQRPLHRLLIALGIREHGWLDLSTLKEPYRIEGKKTMGLEIVEQLGWRMPDVILYPTGGGVGLIGIYKALQELRRLGWVRDRLPRLVT